MATTAQYTAKPEIEYVQIVTANTARDGSGTIGIASTGPAAAAANGVGRRINRVVVSATQTTTAGVIRFFISNDNGTTIRLVLEKLVPAITPSTTVSAFRMEVSELAGLVLPGGTGSITTTLRVSTNAGETFNVMVESGLL